VPINVAEARHLLGKLDACTLSQNRLLYMDTGFR
jgi:hypothetical protein